MSRDDRVRVWEALGRYEALEVLDVGGDALYRDTCPMDCEELDLLLPEGLSDCSSSSRPCLAGLRVLYLHFVLKMDDAWLRTLARAGCGSSLASLTLWGVVFSFPLSLAVLHFQGM